MQSPSTTIRSNIYCIVWEPVFLQLGIDGVVLGVSGSEGFCVDYFVLDPSHGCNAPTDNKLEFIFFAPNRMVENFEFTQSVVLQHCR